MNRTRRGGWHRLELHELAVLFLALNLADIVLTSLLLECGGVEVNPLLCGRTDWPSMKMAMATGSALFVMAWDRPRVMRVLVVGMLCVVGWNVAMTGVALWG
jgi:hypothetical protein